MNLIARTALVGVSSLIALAAVGMAFAQKPKASKPKKAPVAAGVPFSKADAVLKARCVGCHNGPGGRAGVNLTSYASITGGKWKGQSLVVPKKPADSVIVKAIHGTGVAKMPPGGSLPPADIKTIESWIASGAKK